LDSGNTLGELSGFGQNDTITLLVESTPHQPNAAVAQANWIRGLYLVCCPSSRLSVPVAGKHARRADVPNLDPDLGLDRKSSWQITEYTWFELV
jgi:hypothetical protein